MMSDSRIVIPFERTGLLISYPLTLDSLKLEAPLAYRELISMKSDECREVLLLWLNGLSTSSLGENIADRQFIKEDVYSSALRTRNHIEFSSTVQSTKIKHYMTEEQMEQFLINPAVMKLRVKAEIEAERERRDKAKLIKLFQQRGPFWIKDVLGMYDQKEAANDD